MRNTLFDLLRVVAVISLVPYHSLSVLGHAVIILPAFNIHAIWTTFAGILVECWLIPVLFIIAGYSMKASLEKRAVHEFIKERATRLLIPASFIIFFLLPLSEFITGNWMFTVGHAWFLLALFAYSMAFIKVKGSWLFLVITPIAAAFIPFDFQVFFYALPFGCGFVIEKARKIAPYFLVTGICLLPFYIGHQLLVQSFLSIGIVGIVGTFHFSKKAPLDSLAMPFYVMHFTTIAVLSQAPFPPVTLYFFMQLAIPITLVLAWASSKNRVTRVLTGARRIFMTRSQEDVHSRKGRGEKVDCEIVED